MPSYLIESYVSRQRIDEVAHIERRARAAADELAREGNDVRYLRASFLRDDEMCLFWFEAPTPALVTEAGRRAEIEFDRVVETIEDPPRRHGRAPTS